MRILVLCQEYPPVGGGGGRAVKKISAEVARHHRVDLITQHAAGLPRQETVDGLQVYRVCSLGRRDLDTAPLGAQLMYPVAGFLRGLGLYPRGYDLVHAHFAVPTGPLGVALSHLAGVPLVLSVHGSDIYSKWRRLSPQRNPLVKRAVHWVLHRADIVVPQSTALRGKVLDYYGCEGAPRMEVVPLPFDPAEVPPIPGDKQALRRKLDLDTDATYLVSIGRFVKSKGFEPLVAAMAHLPDGVRLLLIGEGPQRPVLERVIREGGLEDRVILTGRIVGERKYEYLAAGDVFVLPSLYEAFGIVVQEAMAVGLPIVYSNSGGHKDMMTDGETGLCIREVTPESIARTARELLDDPDRRARMGRRNRERLKRYHPDVITNRYLDIYERVLRQKR